MGIGPLVCINNLLITPVGNVLMRLGCQGKVTEDFTLAKWLLEFLGIPRIFLGIPRNLFLGIPRNKGVNFHGKFGLGIPRNS